MHDEPFGAVVASCANFFPPHGLFPQFFTPLSCHQLSNKLLHFISLDIIIYLQANSPF
uniref:7-deoxyloganetin glucosyltransferase-like n=1 Tax=Rhizophora mucronata TaxID=61149 RepID=A0A2P2LXS8_RHIMU